MQPQTAGENQEKAGFWPTVLEWVKVIVIALIIALPIRFFIAEPFVVNGASMDPTFSTGQFLIVDRLTYDFSPPQRGDVIVFEYPNDPSVYYIKRIIGLPNETVCVVEGKISIASQTTANNASSSTNIINASGTQGCAGAKPLNEPYIEADHASHDTLTAILGPTQYFVMGDNRAQSSDSRVWGPLDRHFIVGRPIVRLLPPNAISYLPGSYNEK